MGPMGLIGVYGTAVRDLWDLWGPLGFRLGTYRIRRGLRDCGVGYMGWYTGLDRDYGVREVYDLCDDLWGYGVLWHQSYGIYVPAVLDLWDSYGSMGLRCGTYGVIYGDLWDDLWGPQVFAQLWSH